MAEWAVSSVGLGRVEGSVVNDGRIQSRVADVRGTVTSVTGQVSGVSRDAGESRVSKFVSGVTGISGAPVAPVTSSISC